MLEIGNSANLEKGPQENEYLLRGRILEESPYDYEFSKLVSYRERPLRMTQFRGCPPYEELAKMIKYRIINIKDQILTARYPWFDLRAYLVKINGLCSIVVGPQGDTWGRVLFLLLYPDQLCHMAVAGGGGGHARSLERSKFLPKLWWDRMRHWNCLGQACTLDLFSGPV